MGVRFLARNDAGRVRLLRRSGPEDVVILPAFGVTMDDFERLRALGCVLVDTTCGSVLNVWKRVESYARDGYTAVIHGKHYHEETKATASQVMKYPRRPLPRGASTWTRRGSSATSSSRAATSSCAGRADFARASLAGIRFRARPESGWASPTRPPCCRASRWPSRRRSGAACARRYGADALAEHFRSFDTICSATQERQDAVLALLEEPLDVMIVVGGYNSSNTCHLAALVQPAGRSAPSTSRTPTAWTRVHRNDSPPAHRHQGGGSQRRLARRRADHRHHRRRLDAEQQGRRDDRPDQRGRRGGAGWIGGEVGGSGARRPPSRIALPAT